MIQSPTDSRLLDVAVEHFGRKGLDGASTRMIARDAATPMSSITYHFGGKEGLYLAAAEHIARRMIERLGPAMASAALVGAHEQGAQGARAALRIIFENAVEVLVGGPTEAIARFIVREQADPTDAFARIYDGVMGPMLGNLAALLRRVANDRIDDHEARLHGLALFGTILVFRVARATVLRGAGWSAVGPDEVAHVKHIVGAHLDAVFDSLARKAMP